METKKIRKVIPMLAATPEHVINYHGIDYRAAALNIGGYNGYIAIPSEIWSKIEIRNSNDDDYDWRCVYDSVPTEIEYPHGGWTYGEHKKDFAELDRFIPLLDIRKVDTKNYIIIGFDTCHSGDNYKIWTAKTVREEVFRVYDSIQAYIKKHLNK